MEIKEIIKLVVDTLEVNSPADLELLVLPHGRIEHMDARSIILKITEIDEHHIYDVCKEFGCTIDMGIYALDRFHKQIHTHRQLNSKFEECLNKYLEQENITI